MKLIEIGEYGRVADGVESASELVRSVVDGMAAVYRTNGYVRPWIGYVAVEGGVAVGTCAFKTPMREGRVEIAYFTFPGNEGRGVGGRMARELVTIARVAAPEVIVFAQTLPEESASTRILRRLGFRKVRDVEHAEDGLVWEWELAVGVQI